MSSTTAPNVQHHPFLDLVDDCKHIVFQFVLHKVSNNFLLPTLPGASAAFPAPFRSVHSSMHNEAPTHSPASTAPSINQDTMKILDKDIIFLARYMCNFQFGIYVNVHAYLETLFQVHCSHQLHNGRTANPKHLYFVDVTQNETLTNDAFHFLQRCHILHMEGCMQKTISNAALAHLEHLRALHMEGCAQITEGAFVHLTHLHTLDARKCYNLSTLAIRNLSGPMRRINLSGCCQVSISDDIFLTSALQQAEYIDISFCTQLTGRYVENLKNVRCLKVTGCSRELLRNAQRVFDSSKLYVHGNPLRVPKFYL